MDATQNRQENEYSFPYHHLVHGSGETFWQHRNLRWGYEYFSYLYYIIDLLKEHTWENLLDIGCGDGKFIFELQKTFGSTKKIEGVDYSARALSFARAFSPDIQFHCTDINKETIGTFDVITLIETLEHIPPKDIPAFLTGIKKQMHEKSILILTVPTKNVPTSPKHYQHFTAETLTETLSTHFEVTEIRYLNTISITGKLFKILLTNRFFILNNQRALTFLFAFHKKHALHAKKTTAKQILAICRPQT